MDMLNTILQNMLDYFNTGVKVYENLWNVSILLLIETVRGYN